MRYRVPLLALAATTALLTAGCGGDPAESAPSSTSSAAPTTTPTATQSTPGDVTRADGLALLVEPKTGMRSVQVFDWNTGRAVQTVPFQMTSGGFDPSVSKDLRYAVRKGGHGEIEVYKADVERGYVLSTTIAEPTEGYGTGKIEYDDPQFNPKDGRAWTTAQPAKGHSYFVSFDPADAQPKPRRERTRRSDLAGFSPWGFDPDGELWERDTYGPPNGTVTVAGKRGYKLQYWTGVTGKIVDAKLKFDYGMAYGEPEYTMFDKLGPDTLLLRSPGVLKDESTGEVMQVKLDTRRRTASYRAVVPASADSAGLIALYPDRHQVLITTETAWYRVPLGGGGTATKLAQAPTMSLGGLTRIP